MEVKLTDICDIQYGYAFDSALFSETEGIPLVRIRDVVRGFSETRTTEPFPEEYTVHDGDMLIGMDGEFNIAHWHGGTAALNQRVCRLIPKKVDSEYIFHFMPSALKAIEEKTPFVTVKHLSAKELNKITVPIPSPDMQIRIGSILNRVLQIIELRKCELQSLDNLIKARFVEMFGNPFDVRTTIKWPIKTINDLAVSISDGSNVDKALYKNTGDVLFLRIQNVWCNEFRLDDSVFISEAENEMYKDTSLKHGDLLITKIGRYYTADSSLGRVAVYLGEDDKANYSNNIMRVRFRNNTNSEFVNALMNLDDYNKYIRRTSVGGTDKRALSKSLIGSYPLVVPPLEKQNEFVCFIHQINKLKGIVQNALDEAQLLFDSLIQKYFI